GATFIIDDRVELVAEIGADGVHLGKNDMPIREARRILGDKYIIGGTANTFDDVKSHYESSANYIGCGPFRFTTTKKNLSPTLGLDGYRSIIGAMKERDIDIPLVAIGGITSDDVPSIMETGVCGIALSGTILNAENPASMTANLLQLISDAKEKQ
ncbi:MAG: thiamine phosphate synthase, partial [Bacteroidaceae bacterium]|nr:thiamine phosphate synthase [Bacteroidaceae bacterium]